MASSSPTGDNIELLVIGESIRISPCVRRTCSEPLASTHPDTQGGREIIPLDLTQLDDFAGNAIELSGRAGRHLVISKRAAEVLTADQRRRLGPHVSVLPISVPTIELAGGSVRCMIAAIHLAARAPAEAPKPGTASTMTISKADPQG